MHIYLYIYIYIYTHIYTHIYIYIYVYLGVSAVPVVMQYRLSAEDRLLIIATDGVWDMLDNSEV